MARDRRRQRFPGSLGEAIEVDKLLGKDGMESGGDRLPSKELACGGDDPGHRSLRELRLPSEYIKTREFNFFFFICFYFFYLFNF